MPAESFAGKAEEVKELVESCKAAQTGRFERTYVIGERGIGKSSLCNFVRRVADEQLGMLTAHVFLGGAGSVEEMVRRVFEEIAKASTGRPWYDKIGAIMKSHLKGVGLFGVNVQFQASQDVLGALAASLPDEIEALAKQLEGDRKGVLLILDDINGLADDVRFANWLKSFVDTVATRFGRLPLHLVLASLPERRDALIEKNQSLNRPFRIMQTGKVSDSESESFYQESFRKAGIAVEPGALHILVRSAGGYPVFMQEIGDAVYRIDEDSKISWLDAISGELIAAANIGQKYLDKNVYGAFRSEKYRSMLDKLATSPLHEEIDRERALAVLTEPEKKVFDNFVAKMKELDVLESAGRGKYRFKHEIHRLYYHIQGAASRGRQEPKGASRKPA